MKNNQNTSFFQRVYAVVRLVPYGRVTTYGAVARYLGTAKSARMVGWAMNNAGGQEPPVPAHRVVNRQGLLTGKHHFGGNTMQQLLENENIEVIDNQVQNFQEKLWLPEKELESPEEMGI